MVKLLLLSAMAIQIRQINIKNAFIDMMSFQLNDLHKSFIKAIMSI
jgi:hypothetical protein